MFESKLEELEICDFVPRDITQCATDACKTNVLEYVQLGVKNACENTCSFSGFW